MWTYTTKRGIISKLENKYLLNPKNMIQNLDECKKISANIKCMNFIVLDKMVCIASSMENRGLYGEQDVFGILYQMF